MIPKCHPGDLAIIVNAYNQANIGLIVKVLQLHPDQFAIDAPDGDAIWTCQAHHQMVYDIGGKKRKRLKGPVPDSYMYPIKGHLRSPDIALLAELELIWLNSAEAQVCVCPDSHI
jgi:hypothetical protein